jgi:ribosomal protein S18 acetylase RimI-like enzyme
MTVEIVAMDQVTEAEVAAFAWLIPQLSDAPPPSRQDLEAILASPAVTVLLAVDPELAGKILGALTLVIFRTPTAVHAWIEDVVVDHAERNRGIGEALTRAGLQRAAAMGARHVDLTSRPQREAANRLYQRLGFKLRPTNLYRKDIED